MTLAVGSAAAWLVAIGGVAVLFAVATGLNRIGKGPRQLFTRYPKVYWIFPAGLLASTVGFGLDEDWARLAFSAVFFLLTTMMAVTANVRGPESPDEKD